MIRNVHKPSSVGKGNDESLALPQEVEATLIAGYRSAVIKGFNGLTIGTLTQAVG
jgi:hypothetical protein